MYRASWIDFRVKYGRVSEASAGTVTVNVPASGWLFRASAGAPAPLLVHPGLASSVTLAAVTFTPLRLTNVVLTSNVCPGTTGGIATGPTLNGPVGSGVPRDAVVRRVCHH